MAMKGWGEEVETAGEHRRAPAPTCPPAPAIESQRSMLPVGPKRFGSEKAAGGGARRP